MKISLNPLTPKVWAVMRREFMLRVKTKWFLISTLALPVGIFAMMVLMAFIMVSSVRDRGDEAQLVGVADAEGHLIELLLAELEEDSISAVRAGDMEGIGRDEIQGELAESGYDLLLVVPPEASRWATSVGSERGPGTRVQLYSLNSVTPATEGVFGSALQRASVRARLEESGVGDLDPGLLIARTSIDVINITESGEARSQDVYRGISFGVAFLFYMVLILYGQMIVRAVLEEKQSNIVEIIVSSLRPWEMMLGKIVGVGAVGLAQMAVWGTIVTVAIAGLTVFSGTLASAGLDLSSIAFPWGPLAITLVFLVLGYLLYAGMFAGAGATISNEHDAQQAVIPIILLIVVPFMAVQGVIQNPNAGWAVGLSLVPFFSPLLMTSRVFLAQVPLWQWGTSLLLLVSCVVLAAWVAGRIYRVGILMKGQRANLPQVLRWIRHG